MCLRSTAGFVLLIFAFYPVLRACDRHYMQRFDTCTIGSRCKSKLIAEEILYVTDHCKELCERNASCQAAEYHPLNSSCKLYDCTLMGFTKGYTSIMFRKSCTEDCSKFRLSMEDQRNNSITVCNLAYLGRLSNQDCMAECFDTEDCRALVYPKPSYDCVLCSATEEMALDVVDTKLQEARLMRRICLKDEPRQYTQTCLNCDRGTLCQDRLEELAAYNESSCKDKCDTYPACKLSVYDSKKDTCKLFDCGLVQENTDMLAYRKSTSSDCPVFRISILKGFYGDCPVTTVILHVPLLEYCVDKCLDMPGCRGASYIEGMNCRLHDCDSYSPAKTDKTFMKRSCIAQADITNGSSSTLVPLKDSSVSQNPMADSSSSEVRRWPTPTTIEFPATELPRLSTISTYWVANQAAYACNRHYMQRCDTCTIGSRCKSKLIAEEILYVTDHCEELCESNSSCQAAEYHPVNSSCKLYDCTFMSIAKGYTSVVFRKSCSEDCSKFRLKLEDQRNSSISVCTLANLGRLSNQDCMAKCFDTVDCRALFYPKHPYDCMLCSSTEEMSLDVVNTKLDEARLMRRTCIMDEPRNYTQTCLNCDKGQLCQDRLEELVVYNESSCRDECITNAYCKQSVYDWRENTCKLYDCGLVQETTDTKVYRKSPSNDCPIFEISVLNGTEGSCRILTVISHVPLFEYCVEKCLDTTDCRGATYYVGANCRLHVCDSYTTKKTAGKIFMQRKCTASLPAGENLQAQETERTSDRTVSVSAISKTSMLTTSRLTNSLVSVIATQAGDSGETSTERRFISTNKQRPSANTKQTISNLPSLFTVSNSTTITKHSASSQAEYTSESPTSNMSVLPTASIVAQVDLTYRSQQTSATTDSTALENLVTDSSSSDPGSEITQTTPESIVSEHPKTSTFLTDMSTSEAAYGKFYSLIGALSQPPSTTFCPEALRVSSKSAAEALEMNATSWLQSLLAKQQPLSDQKSFTGQQMYILVASVASGIFATACAGPLLLYFLVCRKKKTNSCSPG